MKNLLRPKWGLIEKRLFKDAPLNTDLSGFEIPISDFDKSPYDNLHVKHLTTATIREAVEKLEQFRRRQ